MIRIFKLINVSIILYILLQFMKNNNKKIKKLFPKY